jgi:hypothetical protein
MITISPSTQSIVRTHALHPSEERAPASPAVASVRWIRGAEAPGWRHGCLDPSPTSPIAFLLERANEATYRVRAFRVAAALSALPAEIALRPAVI